MSENNDSGEISWVKTISRGSAAGALAEAYEQIANEEGEIENLYLAMSQVPDVIKPADDHYRALLHNKDNPLAPWLSELIATYVAIICDCEYAYVCHGENYQRYSGYSQESKKVIKALKDGSWREVLVDKGAVVAIEYTEKLTLYPSQSGKEEVDNLRKGGFNDKEISYIIQIAASFSYWSRVINGLGIKLSEELRASFVSDY